MHREYYKTRINLIHKNKNESTTIAKWRTCALAYMRVPNTEKIKTKMNMLLFYTKTIMNDKNENEYQTRNVLTKTNTVLNIF